MEYKYYFFQLMKCETKQSIAPVKKKLSRTSKSFPITSDQKCEENHHGENVLGMKNKEEGQARSLKQTLREKLSNIRINN